MKNTTEKKIEMTRGKCLIKMNDEKGERKSVNFHLHIYFTFGSEHKHKKWRLRETESFSHVTFYFPASRESTGSLYSTS